MADQPGNFNVIEHVKEEAFCPECNEDPPNIREEFSSGDCVCLSCGLVVMPGIVDTRQEWRTFIDGDGSGPDPNRIGDGGDPFLLGGQLHTRIGGGSNPSAAALALSRTQHLVSKDKSNEKMTKVYKLIDAYCAFGKLSSTIVEASKHVAKLAIQNKWFTTYKEQVVCALIFEGCKRAREPRNMKEIARLSGKEIKINRHVAVINRKLTTVTEEGPSAGASRATFAKDLMPRYCQTIGLPVWAETLSVQVAEAVNDTLLLGARSARNVAATVIYIVCHLIGQPKTVSEIHHLAEQAKATVQKSIKLLYEDRELVMRSPHWPTDKRINKVLFDNIMDSKWFSQGSLLSGSKRKVSDSSESDGSSKKLKSTTPESDSSGNPSSQGNGLESSQHKIQSIDSSFSKTTCTPFLTPKQPYGSRTSISANSAPPINIPGKKKKRSLRNAKYGFPPAKEQKLFLWNGLWLPGPA